MKGNIMDNTGNTLSSLMGKDAPKKKRLSVSDLDLLTRGQKKSLTMTLVDPERGNVKVILGVSDDHRRLFVIEVDTRAVVTFDLESVREYLKKNENEH